MSLKIILLKKYPALISRIFCTKINQFSSGVEGRPDFSNTRVTSN